MKQHLSPEQTAKLMELGFEPSTRIPFEVGNDELGRTFSIGELIEMLERADDIEINRYDRYWSVSVGYEGAKDKELIDALFATIVKLKEEGAI